MAYINGFLSILGLIGRKAQAVEPMAPREEARFVRVANLLYGCCPWQSAFFRLFSLQILKFRNLLRAEPVFFALELVTQGQGVTTSLTGEGAQVTMSHRFHLGENQ